MRAVLLLVATCALASGAANTWQRFSDTGCIGDPLHKHCCDVTVDLDDGHAKEWLTANEYKYTKWTQGQCDKSLYPVVEMDTHPPASDHVTLRKLGHGTTLLAAAAPTEGKDCRSDKTSTPISIMFTNKNTIPAKIKGCQNQYACKPAVMCDTGLAPGATETVVLDASFKYFVFTFSHEAGDVELYPDANLRWPTTFDIGKPKAAEAVPEVAMLTEAAPVLGLQKFFHEVEADHKCRESNFTMAGVTQPGRCPSNYDVLEKTETDKICTTGGNIKYCAPKDVIQVSIATYGEDAAWFHVISGNQCFEANHTMTGLNETGACPRPLYSHFERTEVDKICRTGGNVKYCPERDIVWVRVDTRGEGAPAPVEVSMLLEGAATFTINSPSPGSHAHCTQIDFLGGKNNAYYKAHAYQYVAPVWVAGPCGKKYNWFNSNSSIAEGVEETLFGIH